MNRKYISSAISPLLGLLSTLVLSVNIEAQVPRKARIAFVFDRDGNSEIYVMDTNGKNQRNLTNHLAGDTAPAWSPDGRRIAFILGGRLGNDIYVMDADGKNVRQLTGPPTDDICPAWSPDSRQIIFTSRKNFQERNHDIYVIDADGNDLRNLTNHQSDDQEPAWFDPTFSVASAGGKRLLTWGWLKRLGR